MPKHRLRKQNTNYCQYCDEYLSRTGYFKHRKAYYNPATDRWLKKASIELKRPGPKPCGETENNQDLYTSYSKDSTDEKDIWSCSSSGEEEMEILGSDQSKDQNAYKYDNDVHLGVSSLLEDNQHDHGNNE
ncbi:uncharacterized protein LOC116289316 isoform X2 [Actinia tenebrosa]|nr:uncharacterized protein LOC116289316 isoform X2 [Actinia tenebrosa]